MFFKTALVKLWKWQKKGELNKQNKDSLPTMFIPSLDSDKVTYKRTLSVRDEAKMAMSQILLSHLNILRQITLVCSPRTEWPTRS